MYDNVYIFNVCCNVLNIQNLWYLFIFLRFKIHIQSNQSRLPRMYPSLIFSLNYYNYKCLYKCCNLSCIFYLRLSHLQNWNNQGHSRYYNQLMSLLFNMALTYLHTQHTNLLIFFYWFVIKFNQVNYLYDLT